jgi:hypothetical protein
MGKIIGINLAPEDEEIIGTIAKIRETSDLRGVQKEIGKEKLKNFLRRFYPKYNITEIEQILGVPDSTLGYWFNRLKIPFSRNHITNNTIAGNKNSLEIEEKAGVPYKKNTIEITPELAYVIGFTLGDGSVQKFMIEVFNKDEKLRGTLFEFLKPYGSITEERRPNGLWRLRLSSVLIAGLIKNKDGIRKDTIDYILKKGELAKKFIAAFWDAEGSVLKQKKYFHVYLYNSNKYLLETIGSFLKSNGIDYSIINIKAHPERNYSYMGRKIISRKNMHRLGIPKKSLNKWADKIGIHLIHSKKNKMVEEILSLKGA